MKNWSIIRLTIIAYSFCCLEDVASMATELQTWCKIMGSKIQNTPKEKVKKEVTKYIEKVVKGSLKLGMTTLNSQLHHQWTAIVSSDNLKSVICR